MNIGSRLPQIIYFAASVTLPAAAVAECPPCGPDFCKGDSRYPSLLGQKKQRLSTNGYPKYLIELLDRDGTCVARIERSPDGFSIQLVELDGTWTTTAWSRKAEEAAARDLQAGKLSSYSMFNSQRAFACCGDPSYEKRPDYDSALDLNKDLAIIRQR